MNTTRTAPERADRRKSATAVKPIATSVVYGPAILFLALPLYEWIGNAAFFYTETRDFTMLLLNLPSRLFALIGFVLMFYQFVLGIRLPILETVFSRATNLKRHRTLGKAGFVLILLHGVLMLAYDYSIADQLIFDRYRIIGMVALVLLIVGVLAAWFFKPLKLSRKTWKTVHLLAYVAFPLGFIHGRALGTEFATGRWTVSVLFNGLLAVYVLLLIYRLYSYLDLPKRRR